MYASSYAKQYGRPSTSSNLASGDRPSTLSLANANKASSSSTSALSSAGASGVTSGTAKPPTANAQSQHQQTSLGGSGVGGATSATTLPTKPSRYTPIYPTLGSNAPKIPSYTGTSASLTIRPLPTLDGDARHQQVITVAPKSIHQGGYSGYSSVYQRDPVVGQKHQLLGTTSNLSTVSSKSAHNLMDSFPDVFCLSCPPSEFKFSDAYRAKTLPRTGKENERLIGFATLPEQVHRKSVKRGFDFTLMVVGESGLGKSTLINSLFLSDFYQDRKVPNVSDHIKRTTSIQKHTIEIEERGVKLRLTVVDTPGFGDSINCENSWKACSDYIDDQFHQYFQAESGLNRKHIQDGRVHCCLYFVPPYGRGLRPLDVEALKNLQVRCNVIPIIAKADTLTPTEVKELKHRILRDLQIHNIQIYQFPECDEEEDEEFKRQDRELKEAIPFAVASSDTFVEVGGKRIRGRVYPWGIVEVENPSHSDFGKLRTMLIQSHMHDLKETTQDIHYENFRAKAIAQIVHNPRERSKLKRDLSAESTQDMLLQKEAEIKRMQQMISRMEAKLKATTQPNRDLDVIDI